MNPGVAAIKASSSEDMPDLGRFLIVLGLVLVLGGLLLTGLPRVWGPLSWIGRLPGDFSIERPGFRAYFPLGSCLVLSVILTVLLQMFRR